MKCLYYLFLSVLIISCHQRDKTNLPEASESAAQTGSAEQVTRSTPWADPMKADPYFVETTDITSPYGPHSITRNMLQDKSGNFWFASWEGIIRYDGKTFTNFTNKAGLRRFHVFSLLEDRVGNLWFGTIRGGLYRYDGNTFSSFTTREGLASNLIECMLEDRAGNIWFGTDSGVSRYDGKSFTNFTTKEGLIDNAVHGMAQDKNGNIWFGTNGGVCYYDGKSFTELKNTTGSSFTNVRAIIEDRAGNLWLGGNDGLQRYDGNSFTRFTNQFVGNIKEDKKGNLLFSAGSAYGMVVYRYDGKSVTNFIENDRMNNYYDKPFSEIKAEENRHVRQVFCVFEDQAGHIWFCTDGGISRYDGESFTNFLPKKKPAESNPKQ